jgi:hypothetical protein
MRITALFTLFGTMASVATLCATVTAGAQTVALESAGQAGYGWMFRQRAICYVIFPEHVAGIEFEVTALSSAPVETGTGTVIRPFWEGIDLAVAVLRGGIEDRCEADLSDLVAPLPGNAAALAQLERLSVTGETVRDPLHISEARYLTFTAALATGGDPVQQGNSGAFAFVGGRPIGMAYRSADNASAIFMRSEEIHMNVARYLSEHGNTFAAPAPRRPFEPLEGSLPLALERVSAPPVESRFAPENTLREGTYVFDLQGRAQLVYRIEGGPGTMSRVAMTAPVTEEHTLPREVLVEVSPTEDGARWFFVGRYEMGPDGVLDTGPAQRRRARMVRLTVVSAWQPGPVGIGRVSVY